MKWACAAIALLAASPEAVADQEKFTGNELQVLCATENTLSLCVVYIEGFLYGAYAQKRFNEPMCFPEGVTPLQAVQVVEKYFRDRPEIYTTTLGWLSQLRSLRRFRASGQIRTLPTPVPMRSRASSGILGIFAGF